MTLGLALPLFAALVLCGLLAWAGFRLTRRPLRRRRTDHRSDPLQELMRRENLGEAIDLVLYRDARRSASQAALVGRIDQFISAGPAWSRGARGQIRDHVAAAMRMSLRRDARIAMVAGHAQGGGFAILIPGADERAAVRIAERLRQKVAQLQLPRFHGDASLTISFGVAAGSIAESCEGIEAHARRALEIALALGPDNVVPASAIAEQAALAGTFSAA